MPFGAKTTTNSYNTENSTNGVSGKDIFFPSASGPNGSAMAYPFRVLPDLPDREENGVVAKEWRGNVNVNGQQVFRSCIVPNDNPWDEENRNIKAEIDALDVSDSEKEELLKAKNLQWCKNIFFTNVLNRTTGTVQILKGSWEKHVWDEELERWVPVNKRFGGRTIYARFMDFVQTGIKIADPKNPRKAITLKDPTQFDIEFVCKGSGQFNKTYEFRGMFYSADDANLPELYTLPRYDIEEWAKDKGVWPVEALQELKAGGDYYKLVEKYNIALYPSLRATGQEETPVSVTSDDDELFND